MNPPKRKKGPGFLGTLERPDEYTSTELSIGVNIDGKEVEIPSLVPGLTQAEKDYLLQGNKPSREIVDKAVQHARTRITAGQSPFAGPGESNMPINAPRQLSTWLKGMQTRYTPGIQVPQLWGRGEEEYGIDYPLDVVPEEGTAGPEEAADILEAGVRGGTFRAPSVIRGPGGEEEFFGTVPPKPEPPSREEVSKMFDEHFGNPDTYDIEAETVQAMEEEDAEIRERIGIGTKDLRYVSPELKKLYTQRRAEREKEVYTRKAAYLKRITEAKKEKLNAFDAQVKAQQKAGQQARGEAREEERLGIARSAERRAAQPKVKPTLEAAREAFVTGTATPEQVKLLKIPGIKPEYKPGQALEKIASLQRARATFNKTGKIDAMMAKMFPEYIEGQKLTGPEIKNVTDAYDRAISYVGKFAPGKRDRAIEALRAEGYPVTEANIEHVMRQIQ